MSTEILLVEDNRPDAALVLEALKSEHLEVKVREFTDAETTAGYLSRMGSTPDFPCPALVIMDLNLPRGDGLDLLKQIRAHPECAKVPVVVMSSSDSPRDRSAAENLGNTKFFRKPPDLDAFLGIGKIVREILEGDRGSKE
jgi:two-component system, chemotaxis family, response regulator Rcp1